MLILSTKGRWVVGRRWDLVGAGLVLAVLLGVAMGSMPTAPQPAAPEPQKEWRCRNYDQIRVGMKEKDVEALIGCPRGWHKSAPQPLTTWTELRDESGNISKMWFFDDCFIFVHFSAKGEVAGKDIEVY